MSEGAPVSDEADVKDVFTEVPPGLIGNPEATPKCAREFFFNHEGVCPASTQVGVADVTGNYVVNNEILHFKAPVYNLAAPQGVPAEFGFAPDGAVTIARPFLRSDGDYGITVHVESIPQFVSLLTVSFTFWGLPADPVHDSERGHTFFGVICGYDERNNPISGPPCPSNAPLVPLLTNPTDCSHGPFDTTVRVVSWQGQEDSQTFTSHDNVGNPLGVTGCEKVSFSPTIKSTPTAAGQNPSGLNFELQMPDSGLLNREGIAETQPRKVEVALPEGVTVNPSQADGLGVCSPAGYAARPPPPRPAKAARKPPRSAASTAKSPLLQEPTEGSLYLAQPYQPARPVREPLTRSSPSTWSPRSPTAASSSSCRQGSTRPATGPAHRHLRQASPSCRSPPSSCTSAKAPAHRLVTPPACGAYQPARAHALVSSGRG